MMYRGLGKFFKNHYFAMFIYTASVNNDFAEGIVGAVTELDR